MNPVHAAREGRESVHGRRLEGNLHDNPLAAKRIKLDITEACSSKFW